MIQSTHSNKYRHEADQAKKKNSTCVASKVENFQTRRESPAHVLRDKTILVLLSNEKHELNHTTQK